MPKDNNNTKEKIIIINEKDPNYINSFVTDAFSENTPNASTVRITFYEEFGVRPDVETSELDDKGQVVEGSTEYRFNLPIEKKDIDITDMVIVKRIEKATLTMSYDSLYRLRDWLNEKFK